MDVSQEQYPHEALGSGRKVTLKKRYAEKPAKASEIDKKPG